METRLVLAIGLLFLGTMYFWSSPAFVKPTDVRPGAPTWSERFFAPSASDTMWSQGLLRTSLLVVALFAIAALGIWRGAGSWWTWAALAGAVLAILVLVPWWFAVGTSAPLMSVLVNVVLLLWAAALAIVLAAPGLRQAAVRLAGGA